MLYLMVFLNIHPIVNLLVFLVDFGHITIPLPIGVSYMLSTLTNMNHELIIGLESEGSGSSSLNFEGWIAYPRCIQSLHTIWEVSSTMLKNKIW